MAIQPVRGVCCSAGRAALLLFILFVFADHHDPSSPHLPCHGLCWSHGLATVAWLPGAAHAQFCAVAPTPTTLRPAVDKAYGQLMAAPQILQLLEP